MMKPILVTKKTTFSTPDKELKIFDERGILFYSSNFVDKFSGVWTMPKGLYYSDNNITVVKHYEANNKYNKVDKAERNFQHDWTKFKIQFGSNPNKCSIFHDSNYILFDSQFKDSPFYQLAFIIWHEKAHNFYKSEFKADNYAVNVMLKKGFTPSQVMRAVFFTLSEKSVDRKKAVINKITNLYKNDRKLK